jgi:hypothetical protein
MDCFAALAMTAGALVVPTPQAQGAKVFLRRFFSKKRLLDLGFYYFRRQRQSDGEFLQPWCGDWRGGAHH